MLYEFNELAWYVCLTTLAVSLMILWFQKRRFSYLFCFLIFGAYLIGVVSVVVFPIYIPDGSSGEQTFRPNINLVPFYFGDCQIESICRDQIIQNIILTMPFGFGIPFIARLKARDFIWLPFVVGVGLEMSQFVMSQGRFHAADINDVLLNAIGVLLGYGCLRVFGRLYMAGMQFFRIKPRWLFGYIYDVVIRA